MSRGGPDLIPLLDSDVTELLNEASTYQAKYIKSALKTPSPSMGSTGNKSATGSPTPTVSGNSKAHYPARIAEAYAEIDLLNNDKIVLANRLVNLLTLTRARLDADLTKVRTLQGESIDDIRAASLAAGGQLAISMPQPIKRSEGSLLSSNTVVQINESLRNATSAMQDNILPLSPAPGPGYTKSELAIAMLYSE